MSLTGQGPKVSPEAERALPSGILVNSPGACPGCGGPLKGRQKACSAKCRARLSRARREGDRAREVDLAVNLLEQAITRLRRIHTPTGGAG